MLRLDSPHRRLTVRVATADDVSDLGRLAALDSAEPLRGCVMIADVAGVSVAAISLGDGRVVADPFVLSAAAAEMLGVRARQVTAVRRPLRRRIRARRLALARPEDRTRIAVR
jgi:hypothetical protein